jgi:DMSO/TMAO reductase YedYZ heme-binding membrane subunit
MVEMLLSNIQVYISLILQFFIMCFFTSLALFAVAYAFLHVIALLFVDCDLQLAWAEKFGKPIGKF